MKRTDYINWDEYFMGVALLAAKRSKDPSTQVGACIVSPENVIISTGYNGAPRGRKNCVDMGYCTREAMQVPRGERYELCRSVHAEANAIISASRRDMMDSTLYLVGKEVSTGEYVKDANSCAMCKRMIINAGISRVVIRDDKEHWREIAVSAWVENDDSMTDVLGY